MSDLRVPMSVAARQGFAAVAAQAEHGRVRLTSHGRPVAVVDSAERLDDDLRRIRDAARTVVEASADLALSRRPGRRGLEDVCAELGLEPGAVRSRAADLAGE